MYSLFSMSANDNRTVFPVQMSLLEGLGLVEGKVHQDSQALQAGVEPCNDDSGSRASSEETSGFWKAPS